MASKRIWDWADGVAHSLIHCAAQRAPHALSERLAEEWLADLAERHGRLSRLRFAIGCCWATSVIAHEHGRATITVSAVGGSGQFIGYAPSDSPFVSRRMMTFVLVAGLHVAVFYGLAIGLGSKIYPVISGPLVIRPLPAVVPDKLPPPPPPTIIRTKIAVPILDPLLTIDSGPTGGITVARREPPPPDLPPQVGPLLKRIQGGPGNGFPSAEDFYPSSAIHMGEKGVATVKACVDGKGHLTANPTIVQSTGSARLDEGALKLAMAGSGHYRPTTEDGQPVNSCYPFRVRFDLKD